MLGFALVLFGATPALALDARACTDAHLQAQVARSEGRLLQAAEHLTSCGHESCPGLLRAECAQWLEEVGADVPTLIVTVKNDDGRDLVDYELSVDAARVAATTGEIRLDPGTHTVRVVAPGYRTRELAIRLRVAEQRRPLELVLERETRKAQRPQWPLFVVGGVAFASLATFTVAGLSARSSEKELEACAPTCATDDVSAVRTRYTVANVALGVGLASLAAGGIWWVLSTPEESSEPTVAIGWTAREPSLTVSGQF